ncbi:protein-glutamate O-methyltransferase CheR [Phenylobacterium sp.]|jgi:chemotaxis protein methyltransferase CheR|uniref:CheR family methyltransferase n=1 Tax=Phenylobacterium sp. TaxID=1871053 RepID=UPI002F93E372
MTPADGAFVAALCARRAGLEVDPVKVYLLESRLAPVARREGFGSAAELLQAIRDRDEERLAWAVVEAMTHPETSFFRDPEVFAALRDQVLPELARGRQGQPVRIWCAACGSGQEVYSLAMMLADAPLGGAPVEFFASDINSRLLEKAQSGLYTQFEVQRGLPARLLVRHFEKRDEMFVISPRIRQMVRWRRVNLAEDITRLGRFEMVLCRNVMTQLTDAAQPVVMKSLVSAVRQGGALVMGAEETVSAALGVSAGAAPGLYTRVAALRAAA